MHWGNNNIYFPIRKKISKMFAYNNFEILVYKKQRISQKDCHSFRLHCINNAVKYDFLFLTLALKFKS